MATRLISASAVIHAPAEQVYAIVADYRAGHPSIVPPQYFGALVVEQGGTGAGTRIRFQMRALGTTRNYTATVAEPEPGRVLTETNYVIGEARAGTEVPDSITTFAVTPTPDGHWSQVIISTELRQGPGILGGLEGLSASMFLRHVYTQELKLLDTVAQEEAMQPKAGKVTG